MASLVKEAFGEKSLYEILGVEKTATAEQIKRGYYKAALRYHPDKAGHDEASTRKFQALSFVHSVLSDTDKRAEYDRTGSLEDVEDGAGGDSATFETWRSYWRAQFPAITTADIDSFSARYKGSKEEEADVLQAYTDVKGDMGALLGEAVMLATEADEARFVALIHTAIADKRVKAYKKFTVLYGEKPEGAGGAAGGGGGDGGAGSSKRADAAEKARKRRAERTAAEAAEAQEMLAEMRREHAAKGRKGGADASLEDLLAARQASRAQAFSSLLDSLEARYGGKAGKGGVKALTDKGGSRKRSAKAAEKEEDESEAEEDESEAEEDESEAEEECEEEERGAAGRSRARPSIRRAPAKSRAPAGAKSKRSK